MNTTVIVDESIGLIAETKQTQMTDGVQVEGVTSHHVQPEQLASHINMFEADMTLAQKTQAALINANLTETKGGEID